MASIYIYRNLTRQTYSIRYKGRVVDHSDSIWVCRPIFHVNAAGNARVRREHKKYVHAYVVTGNGDAHWPYPTKGELLRGTGWEKVVYNPYEHHYFTLESSGKRIYYADVAYLTPNGVYVLFPRTF